MQLILASSFDDPTKELLVSVYGRVVSMFAAEDPEHASRQGLLDTIVVAILDLANVGQRDATQLERYAESRGRAFLREAGEAEVAAVA